MLNNPKLLGRLKLIDLSKVVVCYGAAWFQNAIIVTHVRTILCVNLRQDPAYFCLHHFLVPREGYDHLFRLFIYLHLQKDVK